VGFVGFYTDRVLPRLINATCSTRDLQSLRQRVCAGLHGRVIEIGFGSGLNVPFYPPAVTAVEAVEPADLSWRLATDRVAAAGVPVHRSGLDGESLPFPDATFDAALSTWTLCTIPDLDTALAELRRVLKPGNTLHFVEHGLAPDEAVRRCQRRLKRFVGGCHLTRPIPELITRAGFTITELDTFYGHGSPKAGVANSLGTATSA
jgi:ubiquinone/menaquinone biosynthesis C-methylase UbiE